MHHQGSTEAHEAWPGSLAGAQDVAAKVHRCQHFVIKAPLRTCGRAWLWLPEAHGVQPSWLTGVPPVGAGRLRATERTRLVTCCCTGTNGSIAIYAVQCTSHVAWPLALPLRSLVRPCSVSHPDGLSTDSPRFVHES